MSVYDRMVAITGGIGAGKSYVSNIFEKQGIPVFNADNCAKDLMNSDSKIIFEFKQLFGESIYHYDFRECVGEPICVNCELDRKALGDIIFNDKQKKQQLEAIVHPAVTKAFMDWKYDKIYKKNYPFVMIENAILTSDSSYKLFKFAILVDAPLEIRKERIMARPGMTQEKMEMIIQQQDNPKDVYSKLLRADMSVVKILNDEKTDLYPQILSLISTFEYRFKNNY
jgi:dephospho-CoA kinase